MTRRRRWLIRVLVAALPAAVVMPVGGEVVRVVVGSNIHEVIPGELYRSAQLSDDALRDTVARCGIRTVINLRGCCPECEWYQRETAALAELGVAQRDVNFSSYLVPPVGELQKLVADLGACERPVLLHCRRGADRTGLASAVALLLTDAGLDEAREQLSWRFGHVEWSRSGTLQQVLDLYENWLTREGRLHRPELLKEWAFAHYRPGPYWAAIEPLEVPACLDLHKPVVARFRVQNLSEFPWQLKQSAHTGFHLRFLLHSCERDYAIVGGAGFFDDIVAPGESLELTLSVPPVPKPGRYTLLVDMADEGHCWFFLVGSKPFQTELVAEAAPKIKKPRDRAARSTGH